MLTFFLFLLFCVLYGLPLFFIISAIQKKDFSGIETTVTARLIERRIANGLENIYDVGVYEWEYGGEKHRVKAENSPDEISLPGYVHVSCGTELPETLDLTVKRSSGSYKVPEKQKRTTCWGIFFSFLVIPPAALTAFLVAWLITGQNPL